MANSIAEYQTVYDEAIRSYELIIEKVKDKIKNMESIEIDLSETNYDDILYKLEKAIESFRKQKYRYIFDRMSLEEFEKVIENVALGRPPKLITVGIAYQVKEKDTLQLISYNYGIPVEDILIHNRMSSQDFEDIKEQNQTIYIPITVDISRQTIFTDLPVYGSQAGKKAWGRDWANEIVWDSNTNDIKVLTPDETLVQGILNGIGFRGDIPGHEDYTIELQIGGDLPDDAYDAMVIAQLESKLLRDKRVRKVENILIDRKEGARYIYVSIYPINSENPIDITPKKMPIVVS